ncbi:NUDIX domain-containing protein [Sciscionella marina]|uniref:NUDIX domain-containing protein n=1 Tax=Sciscionella marina TaxID=508770 RepID=UPI0003684901|nr:NUDIX hydrolase [Sciscionella marina]
MKQLGSTQVYANSWMTVREDRIERPDGSNGIYGVVDKPHYALVIPYEDEYFHLVEQFRYPLSARRWEFPQGTAPERAEVPAATLAERELAEETGLRAGRMTELGALDVAPGLSSQQGTVFLATELIRGEPSRELEEQDMNSAWFSRAELEAMIRSGTIADAQTLAAYLRLVLHERSTNAGREH